MRLRNAVSIQGRDSDVFFLVFFRDSYVSALVRSAFRNR